MRSGIKSWAGVALALMALSSCQFDDSLLERKTACEVDADCLEGRFCVLGLCQDSAEPDLDAGEPDVDDRDAAPAPNPDGAPPPEPEPAPDPEPGPLPDAPPAEDRDGDGIADDEDLCPDTPDPDQEDFDGNLIGDACQRPDRSSLFISEIMLSPVFANDTERAFAGQYVEIHNGGASSVDLKGFELTSDGRLVLISESIVVEPGSFALLGGTAVSGERPGDVADWLYGDGLILPRQGPGDVSLVREVGGRTVVYDAVVWDETWPFAPGTSLGLTNLGLSSEDRNFASLWCPEGTVLGGGQDGGTPRRAQVSCAPRQRVQCEEAPELSGERVLLWGTTASAGPSSTFEYFQCNNRGQPFDGRHSPESFHRFTLSQTTRVTAILHTEADFDAIVYLRRDCNSADFDSDIACGISRGEREVLELNFLNPGAYVLVVDGDDDGSRDRASEGIFTLELLLER